MKMTEERWAEFYSRQTLKIETRLDSIMSLAEHWDNPRRFETKLRSLRRYIDCLLGERDDCGELLPDDIHKAPAFCRSECAGNGPNCGGCSHGGYGPGEQESASLYRATVIVKKEEANG